MRAWVVERLDAFFQREVLPEGTTYSCVVIFADDIAQPSERAPIHILSNLDAKGQLYALHDAMGAISEEEGLCIDCGELIESGETALDD